MPFSITDHVEFDAQGRAVCPSCAIDGKTRKKNLALVPNTDGAYKCHRGCSSNQIREALGSAPKRETTPQRRQSKGQTVSPSKVIEAHKRLLAKQGKAMKWLCDRNIHHEAIVDFRLGVSRAKCGDTYLSAIVIPIPNHDGTAYWQKKRVAPWLKKEEQPDDYKAWSQFGVPQTVYFTHKPDGAKQTYLCEGEWDAIRLGHLFKTFENIAVASFTCGCSAIPEAAELDRLPGEVIIFYDRDQPGRDGALKLARRLGSRARVATVPGPPEAPEGWDISDYLGNLANGIKVKAIRQAAEEAVQVEAQINEPDPEDLCRLARRYKRIYDKLKGRLRWNQLRGVVELDGKTAELEFVRMTLALKYNIDIPDADVQQIVLHIARENAYSPIAEYLQKVAETYPPDSDLLDGLTETLFGVQGELYATYLRKTLISAVARALKPGCKVDSVCILAGPQGCGKSSFWHILAGDYFDDSVGSVSDKDERLKLHKAWIVEWAELEAVFKRKDVSAVKSFITTQTDQVRPPYGRTVQAMDRPSIIVGTTNFSEFLADSTGNRRFWVIKTELASMPLNKLVKSRDRIWAAAVHAYRDGEHWTLPAELREAARLDSENYEMSDPWEKAVLTYLAEREQVTADEVLANALELDIGRHDRAAQMRVTNLLKAAGWAMRRRRMHGMRVRMWFSPNSYILDGPVGTEGKESRDSKGLSPGPTSAQPPAQPPAQPDFSLTSESVAQRPDLDHPPGPNFRNLKVDQGESGSKFDHEARPESWMFEVGDKVEIQVGQFQGRVVPVVGFKGDRVLVRAKKWQVTRDYAASEVLLA